MLWHDPGAERGSGIDDLYFHLLIDSDGDMMNSLQSWIQGLVAASVLAALAQQLTPNGPVKKVTEFVCGVMLMAMLLSPVLNADRTVFSYALSDYRQTVAELSQDLETQEKQLLRVYIEQQSQAYILDEARLLGLTELQATVQVKWGDESWVPIEVYLNGAPTPEQKSRLSGFLDAELGIPVERQHWNE